MKRWKSRLWTTQWWAALSAAVLLCMASIVTAQAHRVPAPGAEAALDAPPVLVNPGFECDPPDYGYVPQPGITGQVAKGWTAVLVSGNPLLNSTTMEWRGDHQCIRSYYEKIERYDSMAFVSEDIETPPEPGKPFDATVYQLASVTPGKSYSLSGWMLSLCGGSAQPSDCPAGYYMAKMLGIDPSGGTDPTAASVIWVEDRRNFTESRWANLRLGATAQSSTMTVFARINSPFLWHGAHAFIDAMSLVRSPTASFVGLPAVASGSQVSVQWTGDLGPDIPAIPAGNYQLLFDVQHRSAGETDWIDWQVGQPAGSAVFAVNPSGPKQTVEFRLRARAEQPEGQPGAWPNHRYPSDWSAPAAVVFAGSERTFLPLLMR